MHRKSYSSKEKLKTLELLRQNNNNISKTARDCGITNKMLRDWLKQENKICEIGNKATVFRMGSGRTAFFPEIEEELKVWLTTERKTNKRLVTYSTLREQAIKMAASLSINNFIGSNCWIENFMKRNGFSVRKITSVGQEDNRSIDETRVIIHNYFELFKLKSTNIDSMNIYNMDETPMYVDMMNSRTISFKGEKNTEVLTTGHQKTRFTVVLTISLAGKILKSLLVLKGLKNPPKCPIPKNIMIFTSKSGTMDKCIMKTWINTCLKDTGPFNNSMKSVLLMDNYGSHKNAEVLALLQKNNFEPVFIPPRTTSFLQPLDVLINSIFKAKMKKRWEEWFLNGEKIYTKGGYRQKPTWEKIFSFVSESIIEIQDSDVVKSFRLSGISQNGINLNEEFLNHRLKDILYSSNVENLDFIDDNDDIDVHSNDDSI